MYIGKAERTVTKEGAEESTLIPPNSVMVTCIASIGEIAITETECVTNQQINSIICNKDVNPIFVYYLIKFNKPLLKRWAGITTSPIIKKSAFEKFPVFIPALSEQNRIAGILKLMDDKLSLEKQRMAQFETIKKGLLRVAFNDNE